MAQDQTILGTDGVDGTTTITRLNAALAAAMSCLFGPIDPATQPALYTVQPGTLWWDTSPTPDELKVRDAANSSWVTLLKIDGAPGPAIQALLNAKLALAGGTLTNFLTLHANPSTALHAATKQYVDSVSRPAPLRFSLQGNAQNGVELAAALVEQDCQLTAIRAFAKTAPVGASLTATLTRKRTAVADDSRNASILTGTNAITATLGSPMAFLAGDRVELGISSVGSSTPGGNYLVVTGVLAPP